MIAELKPYSDYREAEGGWLGKAPAHWRVRRLKYLLSERDTRSTSGKEQLLRVSQYTGVTKRQRADGLEEPDTRADSLVGYKVVQPQDLVINIMLAWNGSMGVSLFDGIASPAYCVYRFAPDAQPWFFHNLLRCPTYKQRIKAMSTGVVESRLRLYSDDLFRIEALLPPPEEQAVIVRFLEHANGRLERAIRAKRKVIALLNEQKQAIIHRAVTRGLNPNAPLKPSGIPWLGAIPAHWEVRRVKHLARVQGGYAFPASMFGEKGTPVVRMTNLRRGHLVLDDVVRIPTSECVEAFGLRAGDILYGLSGSVGATGSLGNYAVVLPNDLPAMLNQRVARFVPHTDMVVPAFLVLLIQTSIFYEQVLADTTGTAQFNVSTRDIENVTVALPPTSEQQALIAHIAEQSRPLNTAIHRLEREIALLREYRTRLVADVVTGKLDVRPAAASLPDDLAPVPELVSADEAIESETEEPDAST